MIVLAIKKKKLVNIIFCIVVLIVGISIGILAVITSVKISAETSLLPIYSVNRNDKKIALTFDAAWGNSDTQFLIDTLGKLNVKATFFVTGEWVDKYPDDVKAFFDAGHEIANHSDSHPHPNELSINELIEDTKSCSNKIKKVTGTLPKLYRAPYGEYNDTVVSTINGMDMYFIQWSCDSIDWQDPTPEEMKERILNKVQNGSILLFHNDKENTANAISDIISSLQESGYEFVTVSELIYTDDYEIDSSGTQYKNN